MTINQSSANGKFPSTNGNSKIAATLAATSQFQFLKPIKFQETTFGWSYGALFQSKVLFSDEHGQKRIGSFLKRSKTVVRIKDEETYKRVTIRIYGKGVKVRNELKGKGIGTKSQFLVKQGQFILSRIDARNGAFAIATDEIDGAIVTNDFPVYDIDESIINPDFFALLITTNHFSSYFQSLSSGTTNRQRINESNFLNLQIPVPSIKTQEKLITDYQNKISQAEKFKTKAENLEKKIENYLLDELGIKIQQTEETNWQGFKFLKPLNLKELNRWDIGLISDDFQSSLYKNLTLKDVTIGKPQYGANEKAINKISNCRYIRITDINEDGSLNDDFVSVQKVEPQYLLKENDFLIARSGATVGKTFLYKEDFGKAVYAGYLVRYKIDSEIINPEYLLLFTKSAIYKNWIKLNQRISAQPNINGQEFLNSTVILPPLKIQNNIVNHVNSSKAKIRKLKLDEENLRRQAKDDFESELFEL